MASDASRGDEDRNSPPRFPEFQAGSARAYVQAVAKELEPVLGTTSEGCQALARVQSQLGDRVAAEQWARRALAQEPARMETPVFLAELLVLQDRLDEAAGFLREALALQPDRPGAQYRLGMVLDRLGDREGARRALEAAVAQSPNDATVRLVLGRLLLNAGETAEAARQLEKACQLDPKLSGAWYARSQAQGRLGQSESAQRSLETFHELKQQEKAALDVRNLNYDDERFMRTLAAGFHTEAAALLLRQQQPALAEAQLRQASRIAPTEPAAYGLLGAMLVKSRRLPEAREVYETLVRLRPDRAEDHVNLGTLRLQLGDFPGAVAALRRALELDPDQPAALNNLARYYLGRGGEPAGALELTKRLAQVQPTAASQDLLGWALFANGKTNEARTAAARAVELDPANPVYRQRLERLGGKP